MASLALSSKPIANGLESTAVNNVCFSFLRNQYSGFAELDKRAVVEDIAEFDV